MVKLFHAVLTGLVGAALLHVVIILALPRFVREDAYARVAAMGEPGRFHRLDDAATTIHRPPLPPQTAGRPARLASSDPFLTSTACTVSVEDGPVRLYAEGDVPFWSVVIYDRASNEVFSMNDRTSVNGALDILLGTKAQLPAIRKNLPEELAQSILVEMPASGGYAVLRAFSPRRSFKQGAEDFLADAECGAWRPGAEPSAVPGDTPTAGTGEAATPAN